MDIDSKGNLLIQEDPGGNPHLVRIVAYRISDGARGVLAQFGDAAVLAYFDSLQPVDPTELEFSRA